MTERRTSMSDNIEVKAIQVGDFFINYLRDLRQRKRKIGDNFLMYL